METIQAIKPGPKPNLMEHPMKEEELLPQTTPNIQI
jgi:hypothetical protein